MSLRFRDFAPKQLSGRFFSLTGAANYESFEQCVAAAGEWIESEDVDVLNVETVLLPTKGEDTTAGEYVHATGAYWHQFVRVWHYRKGD